jgi:hypothetical protein
LRTGGRRNSRSGDYSGIAAQGFIVIVSTPDELGRFIRAEHEKWGKLVRQSGAKVD